MAESCAPPLPDSASGHDSDCDFVDAIPESLLCPVCFLPFRDPHLVSCCGAKYCEPCIGRVKAAGQPCPLCIKQQFVSLLDRSLQRKVLELKVRCSRKKDGCEWEGELRHLSDHEREECVWALVECGYHCGERLPRRQLTEHEQNVCPQRPVDVKLESFMRNMEEQPVDVKLESFMRKMEELHMREMAAVREELEKTKQVMEKKLAEQKDQYTSKLREIEESLAKLNTHLSLTPPYEFMMTECSKHKRKGRNWFSPPFYSGPVGYKMCLCVDNDGFMPGYFSLSVYLMRGEHDERLAWPFRGDITIQLVNQINDQNHMQVTLKFSTPISSCCRVTSGERAKSGCEETFMHSRLFVKDDCIKFRVTNIAVTS